MRTILKGEDPVVSYEVGGIFAHKFVPLNISKGINVTGEKSAGTMVKAGI